MSDVRPGTAFETSLFHEALTMFETISSNGYSRGSDALKSSHDHAFGSYQGWRPGELDIHFIQTGCGEQTFFIFPDGTTMLLDCGDMYRPQYLQYVPRKPSPARLGGEWVSRYVQRLISERSIDYFVLTHWHSDHCGAPDLRSEIAPDGRYLCGITKLAEDFDIRNYFDHQYPRFGLHQLNADVESMKMVRDWLPYMERRCGMKCHAFEVGAKDQIRMLRGGCGKFPFSIRNIHANCIYWDGGTGTVDYAPDYARQHPDHGNAIAENSLSLGFRLDYGKFSAYFGGDIDNLDYESRLAPIIGKVDVCKMNHHGCPTSMGAELCRALKAKLYLSCVWSPNQVTEKNLVNMASRDLYPGERYICPGHLPAVKRREYEGRDFMKDFLPHQGHTVIKVAPGGESWEFFVLTAENESMEIIEHKEMPT